MGNMGKPSAPNFREVETCNECKHSESLGGEHPGGTAVKCLKYSEASTEWSIYNMYVCDGYEPLEENTE